MHATRPIDREHERLRLLAELAAEQDPGWEEAFQPGTFGCHELLDRTAQLADLVEGSVLNHPSCLQDPEWFAMAEQAVSALRELYQRVGEAHLDIGNDAPSGPGHSSEGHQDEIG